MSRNSIRIVSNSLTGTISYYYKNEMGEWHAVSSNSSLSRQKYTNAIIGNDAEEIVKEINCVYNRRHRGLDIMFSGSIEDFYCLRDAINKINEEIRNRYEDEKKKEEANISIFEEMSRVIFVGKIGSGKSTLINAIQKLEKIDFDVEHCDGYTSLKDRKNNITWYEINGIELGEEHIRETLDIVEKVIDGNTSFIVYCLKATSGKIENAEDNFISTIISKYPECDAVIALTMSINKEQGISDDLERTVKDIKIIPLLAEEFQIDEEGHVKKAFGVDNLMKYVFERR